MFCKNCGKEIPDDSKFCSYCGSDLSKIKSTTEDIVAKESDYEEDQRKSSVTAYLGFFLSLVPMFIDILIIISTTALVLSVVGLCDCKNNNKKGKGFAETGIIISILDIIFLGIQYIYM